MLGAYSRAKSPADLPVVKSSRFEFVIISRQQWRSALRCRLRSSLAPTR